MKMDSDRLYFWGVITIWLSIINGIVGTIVSFTLGDKLSQVISLVGRFSSSTSNSLNGYKTMIILLLLFIVLFLTVIGLTAGFTACSMSGTNKTPTIPSIKKSFGEIKFNNKNNDLEI